MSKSRLKPWHLKKEIVSQVTYCGLSLYGDNRAILMVTVMPADTTCKRCRRLYQRRWGTVPDKWIIGPNA